MPGDKVATGWPEGIELLKLTGLLGTPNNCARSGESFKVTPVFVVRPVIYQRTELSSETITTFSIEACGRTPFMRADTSTLSFLIFEEPSVSSYSESNVVYSHRLFSRHAILAWHFPFPGLRHLRKGAGGYTWFATPIDLGSKAVS
jgi:hypothetical protein